MVAGSPGRRVPLGKRYFYETHDQLRATCKTSSTPTTSPGGSEPSGALTPYEFICKAWTSEPHRFGPLQQMPGLNIEGGVARLHIDRRNTMTEERRCVISAHGRL
jgi:hypothetical protein